ncbi:hypothetical protein KC19_4G009000 [Ceratodon purpureus]|uniref:Secreted protein n=1 Tax=Ceratodon purpureus TaxID=3225 RepID=A0A8T0I5J2_CERPU|nr:hypothetical protein KC19_4G009000 [Ceratodon purpureus]
MLRVQLFLLLGFVSADIGSLQPFQQTYGIFSSFILIGQGMVVHRTFPIEPRFSFESLGQISGCFS